MPPTRNLNAYAYHERVLETALRAGGAKLALEDRKKAFVWRRDANFFRSLLREQSPDHRCKYDVLKLTLQDAIIIIEIVSPAPAGKLMSLDEQPIDVVPAEERKSLSLEERLRLAEEDLSNDD